MFLLQRKQQPIKHTKIIQLMEKQIKPATVMKQDTNNVTRSPNWATFEMRWDGDGASHAHGHSTLIHMLDINSCQQITNVQTTKIQPKKKKNNNPTAKNNRSSMDKT